MKNFIQPGDVVTVPAPADVLSGAGVLVGKLFGIAAVGGASGADVEIKTRGVFEINKLSAEAWTVGADVYWDNTNKQATIVSTSNTLIGKALAVAANPSATGIVRLNG
jgi:predicted RecA/RadA family phage recombinase